MKVRSSESAASAEIEDLKKQIETLEAEKVSLCEQIVELKKKAKKGDESAIFDDDDDEIDEKELMKDLEDSE